MIESAPYLIYHNAKHDIEVLERHGFKVRNVPFYDTMLMFHMLHENEWSKSLDYTSRYYGGKPKNRSKLMQDIINTLGWSAIPPDILIEYAINDAEITYEAWLNIMIEFFLEFGEDAEAIWEREQKFTLTILDMELNKVLVDLKLCEKEAIRGEIILTHMQHELGFNPNSGKDLERILIEELGLPVLKKSLKTGKPSFDKETMEQYEEEYLVGMESQLAQDILRYRGWSKAVTAYFRAYLRLHKNGELRPNFKIHGTRTGRLSCEEPNLQQIPKLGEKEWNRLTKKAFLARPGYTLIEFDYAQLELRLATAYAKDYLLLEVFENDRDVFSEMAKVLGWDRDDAKKFSYVTMYGGGVNRVKNVFGVSFEEARMLRAEFFDKYPKLLEYMDKAKNYVKTNGYIDYWTKRRRHFPGNLGNHKAFNALIQGGGFEIVKDAMIYCHDEICNKDCKMVLQVHDSIWFEIKQGMEEYYIPIIEKAMTSTKVDFGVPFKVEHKILAEGVAA